MPQEPAGAAVGLYKIPDCAGVGEVAAGSAGAEEFSAGGGIALDDESLSAGLCGENRGEQAGRAGAYYAESGFHNKRKPSGQVTSNDVVSVNRVIFLRLRLHCRL